MAAIRSCKSRRKRQIVYSSFQEFRRLSQFQLLAHNHTRINSNLIDNFGEYERLFAMLMLFIGDLVMILLWYVEITERSRFRVEANLFHMELWYVLSKVRTQMDRDKFAALKWFSELAFVSSWVNWISSPHHRSTRFEVVVVVWCLWVCIAYIWSEKSKSHSFYWSQMVAGMMDA